MGFRWGLVFAAVVAGLMTVLVPATAHACSCVDRSLVATLADPGLATVFTATAVDGPDHSGDADGTGNDTWELRVQTVYRGQVPATVTVSTHHQESACGMSFVTGRLYLVAPYAGNAVGRCGATTSDITPEASALLGSGYPPTADSPGGWSSWGAAGVGAVGVVVLSGVLWMVWRRRRVG